MCRSCILSPAQVLLCSSRFPLRGFKQYHYPMPERQQIDRDIHKLLDEANAVLRAMQLHGTTNGNKAADLITRMMACAEQANDAGREDSARHVRYVAGLLSKPHEPAP